MLVFIITLFLKIINSNEIKNNNISDNEIHTNLLSNALLTDVCVNAKQICESIYDSICKGIPITATITKKNPRDKSFQYSDVLEILKPHEINPLFFYFQPNKNTLEFINKNNSYLVIKLKIEDPIRANLLTPQGYSLEQPSLLLNDNKTTSIYIDSSLVYKINKPNNSSKSSLNTIFIENQPIFSISNQINPNCPEETNVYLAECNNAAENVKNKKFIYKKIQNNKDLYLDIKYEKKYCDCQYLIKECLIANILKKVKKITIKNQKCIEKGLIGALKYLENMKLRCKLAEISNKCEIKPKCHCKRKCEIKDNNTTNIGKICPTKKIECLKYCWYSTFNCLLMTECVMKVNSNFIMNDYSLNKTGNYCINNSIVDKIQYIEKNGFNNLLGMIYNCNSIFEIRALISIYLNSCNNDLLTLSNCRYDMMRSLLLNNVNNKKVEKTEKTEKNKNIEMEVNSEEEVSEEATDDESSSSINENKKKSGSKLWIWITVSILAVVCIGIGGYLLVA